MEKDKIYNFEIKKYEYDIEKFKEYLKSYGETNLLIEIDNGEIEALKKGQIVYTETDGGKCVVMLPPNYLEIVKKTKDEGAL